MACYKKFLLPVLVILSIAINLYFRLSPLFLPLCDKIAEEEVHSRLFEELETSINLVDPGLPKEFNRKLARGLFEPYLREKKHETQKEIAGKSKELKDYYYDERGYSYFIEADAYRWQRRIENFLNTGHFGTSRVNGAEYDNLMFAPFGAKVEPIKLHFYIGAYFYKILHFINDKLTLSESLSFLTLFLSAVMVVCVFWVSILFGVSYLGSFLNSLAVGLFNMVLQRSSFGWFDTDLYNIIFPIIVIIALTYSFKAKTGPGFLYLALAGFLTGAHSALWSVWWLPFYITLAGLFLYQLEIVIYDKSRSIIERAKNSSFVIFAFVSCAYLSVLLISGFQVLKNSFVEPASYLSLRNGVALDNFWPDLAFSIAELRKPDIKELMWAAGGSFVVYSGLIGVLLLFVLRKRLSCRKDERFLMLALFAWMSISLFLTMFGSRFIIFFAIFLSVSFGALWDFIARSTLLARMNKMARIVLLSCLFLIAASLLVRGKMDLKIFPFMTDSWWKMMVKIKEATPEDAVIAARWDVSDYVMTIAKRATIDDASWQFTPLPYWINRAFLSRNEAEAVGILRMLNSGGNKAFDELSKNLGGDKRKAMEVINKILPLNAADSRALLSGYVKDENEINKILRLMYSAGRPAYILVDNRMKDLLRGYSIIANWDFDRFDLWKKSLELKEADFINYAGKKSGYPEKDARGLFLRLKSMNKKDAISWISPFRYTVYTDFAKENLQGEPKRIVFDNGIALDLENKRFYFRESAGSRWMFPGRLIFLDKNSNEIKEYKNDEGDDSLCVLLVRQQDKYVSILLNSIFSDTLFFKLYFLEGLRQSSFQFVHRESKEDLENISLFKINFEKQDKGDAI